MIDRIYLGETAVDLAPGMAGVVSIVCLAQATLADATHPVPRPLGAAGPVSPAMVVVVDSRTDGDVMTTAAAATKTPFPFQTFERPLAADTDVIGATREMNDRLPPGSPLASYAALFQMSGGTCEIINDPRFPNSLVCSYNHGLIIVAQWRCVVTYNPATGVSTTVKMTFSLLGP